MPAGECGAESSGTGLSAAKQGRGRAAKVRGLARCTMVVHRARPRSYSIIASVVVSKPGAC
jgi:hypothetical protein